MAKRFYSYHLIDVTFLEIKVTKEGKFRYQVLILDIYLIKSLKSDLRIDYQLSAFFLT
jgi:hypothetical protein